MQYTPLRIQPEEYERPHVVEPVAGERDSLPATLHAVRQSWWIILLCALVAGGLGAAVIATQPPSYDASTYVLLANNDYQQAVGGGYNPSNPLERHATLTDLLTPALLARAAKTAGVPPGTSYAVTTGASTNSDVMRIVASTGNARTAAALADAATDDLVTFAQRSNANQLLKARAVLGTQIATAPNSSDRKALVGELNNLATLKALSDQSVQVIQGADVPAAPSSPKKVRSVAIALVLGLMFGLAVSLLRRRNAGTPA